MARREWAWPVGRLLLLALAAALPMACGTAAQQTGNSGGAKPPATPAVRAAEAEVDPLVERIDYPLCALLAAKITDPQVPPAAAAAAREWAAKLLALEWRQFEEHAGLTFQRKEQATYDAVALAYPRTVAMVYPTPFASKAANSPSQIVEFAPSVHVLKQTRGLWLLTFPMQQTAGKSDAELAALVTALARKGLVGFAPRQFELDGEYGGVKVFTLVVDETPAAGDWRDSPYALVEPRAGRVSFAGTKKERREELVGTDQESNYDWFSRLAPEKGTGEKPPASPQK